ncbi:MAG: hypothetical protein Q7J12_00025, partial [Syntrophales bacterium]|nr:hypothetical protein [Syntrophales bacterium]
MQNYLGIAQMTIPEPVSPNVRFKGYLPRLRGTPVHLELCFSVYPALFPKSSICLIRIPSILTLYKFTVVAPPFELKKLEAVFRHKVFKILLAK